MNHHSSNSLLLDDLVEGEVSCLDFPRLFECFPKFPCTGRDTAGRDMAGRDMAGRDAAGHVITKKRTGQNGKDGTGTCKMIGIFSVPSASVKIETFLI